ncbi:WYL domain-containing protein, partial [Thermodesulfobacteriota bacterium]
ELVKHQIWHKDQEILEEEDGTIIKLPVHDDREIMMKILQYGAQARVRKPAHLYQKIREEIVLLRSRYR